MRLTIPHLYDFGDQRELVGADLTSPESWDAIRGTECPFGLATSREAWEERTRHPDLERRAKDILAVARRLGARRLASYGVGAGDLELTLARLAPDLDLVCTDYAPRTVAQLARLFPEAEVVSHDLGADGPVEADLHLLHRIDTEFSDDELRQVLSRFRGPVVLVPALLLGPRVLAQELYTRVFRRNAARAGWARNGAAFRALWGSDVKATKLEVGGDRAFLLEPRSR